MRHAWMLACLLAGLEGVSAGAYLILAAEPPPLEGVAWPDASLFESLKKMATTVTLAEDEQKTMNLQVARLEK